MKINFEIEMPFNLDCEECRAIYPEIYYNCRKNYSDCRHYNKDVWNKIDKKLNEIRKTVFNQEIESKQEEK